MQQYLREDNKDFVHVPSFNGAEDEDFELCLARLMAAFDGKDQSDKVESVDGPRNDSNNKPQDQLT